MTDVVAIDKESTVATQVTEVMVVAAGEQGPEGPQGPPGPAGGSVIQRTAGETLGGHRAVYSLSGAALYCSASNNSQVEKYLGITVGAASVGTPANVQRTGELVDPAFSFTPGDVYLGENGMLTQTMPTTGNLLVVGYAESATVLILDPQTPIQLGG